MRSTGRVAFDPPESRSETTRRPEGAISATRVWPVLSFGDCTSTRISKRWAVKGGATLGDPRGPTSGSRKLHGACLMGRQGSRWRVSGPLSTRCIAIVRPPSIGATHGRSVSGTRPTASGRPRFRRLGDAPGKYPRKWLYLDCDVYDHQEQYPTRGTTVRAAIRSTCKGQYDGDGASGTATAKGRS